MHAVEPRRFWKLEGCENHFVVAWYEALPEVTWKKAAEFIASPSLGVGSDGVLLLRDSKTHDFDVFMLNPDGSAMGMCGNGIRCVTRFLVLEKALALGTGVVRFNVLRDWSGAEGRTITCTYEDDARTVHVDMGLADFSPSGVPHRHGQELVETEVQIAGAAHKVTALSMGNPHCVIFVDDVESVKLDEIGPLIENDPLFPQRTNVEFVQVLSPRRLRMRVWERGAGETRACGTGACASLVAASRTGRSDSSAEVLLPGGSLFISWDEATGRVSLSGPAREIFSGSFSLSALERWDGRDRHSSERASHVVKETPLNPKC